MANKRYQSLHFLQQSCTKWWFNNQHDDVFLSCKFSCLIVPSLIFALFVLLDRNPKLFFVMHNWKAWGISEIIPHWERRQTNRSRNLSETKKEHPRNVSIFCWKLLLHFHYESFKVKGKLLELNFKTNRCLFWKMIVKRSSGNYSNDLRPSTKHVNSLSNQCYTLSMDKKILKP